MCAVAGRGWLAATCAVTPWDSRCLPGTEEGGERKTLIMSAESCMDWSVPLYLGHYITQILHIAIPASSQFQSYFSGLLGATFFLIMVPCRKMWEEALEFSSVFVSNHGGTEWTVESHSVSLKVFWQLVTVTVPGDTLLSMLPFPLVK